jgi:hypothetical protein
MAKLCQACQTLVAERGPYCPACRYKYLQAPASPNLRPGIWKLAVVIVGLVTIASSLIAAAVVTHQGLPWQHRVNLHTELHSTKSPVTFETSLAVEEVTRTVYPYSIVPGGADNLDEAKRAMRDPIMKAHFAVFDLTKLRQVKLTKNLTGYVSYRFGEQIYWTSEPVTIRAGETVFTDGISLARGRCLNSYSPTPLLPISENEPTEQILDTPVEIPVIAYSFPKLPVQKPELPPLPEELTPTVPIFPPAAPATTAHPGDVIWFPQIPIIPPIHRRPGHQPPPSIPPGL